MKLLKRFYPWRYVDSAYLIDFERLYREGCRGVLFDIDNTLVPHGASADKRAKKLFRKLQKLGMKSCLISNNQIERVKSFADEVGTNFIEKAHKPSTKSYIRAMEQMGTGVNDTIFVGDQLFTDVYGANRTGIRTILVKPIHPKEEIQIVWKRHLEKIVLHFYKKECKKRRGLG